MLVVWRAPRCVPSLESLAQFYVKKEQQQQEEEQQQHMIKAGVKLKVPSLTNIGFNLSGIQLLGGVFLSLQFQQFPDSSSELRSCQNKLQNRNIGPLPGKELAVNRCKLNIASPILTATLKLQHFQPVQCNISRSG